MPPRVTWSEYRRQIGDRSELFTALVAEWGVERALYVGSYVDLSPSTAIADVTYVDIDARAERFFAEPGLVHGELGHRDADTPRTVRFLREDFRQPLDVVPGSMDLLISLFTAPAWETCRQYVRPGGLMLANSSHGEASLAALDEHLSLAAVVHHRDGRFRLQRDELDDYLVPRNPEHATVEHIRRTGRGIAYERSAFAYVFSSA